MRVLSLQSGTSADGIDVAIVDFAVADDAILNGTVVNDAVADDAVLNGAVAGDAVLNGAVLNGTVVDSTVAHDSLAPWLELRTVDARTVGWSPELRSRVLALADGAQVTAEEFCTLNTLIGQSCAAVAEASMRELDTRVDLVVSHGQTVYHWVKDGHARGTLQLGEAAWIAEATGAPVLSNLRAADIAAGGEGAPLMGVFDRAWLGASAAEAGTPLATVNLGGIANLSIVTPGGELMGWDTGPGNCLIDAVIARATGGEIGFDEDGRIAAAGRVNESLLAALLEHPYLARTAPKSTGRETFGLAFVDSVVEPVDSVVEPVETDSQHSDSRHGAVALEDLVATLTQLTARTISNGLRAYGDALTDAGTRPKRLIASGGGVHNPSLMTALGNELGEHGIALESCANHGIDPDFKESLMFALLGFMSWHGIPCQLPATEPTQARIAGQLAFGPAPLTLPYPLTRIRGLRILSGAHATSESAATERAVR